MRWSAWLYGAIAVIACGGAFIGLSSGGFWIDELFTIHVIDHHGGLSEVLRRALTDVHPPLYYFFMYEWSRLFGFSETSLRLPSALFAVLAIGLFVDGARHVSRGPAIAFACAVATVSAFWFDQSQNARSYALALSLSAALSNAALALHRHTRRSPGSFPVWRLALLAALGLAASLTHAYLLLATGMVWFFLLLGNRDGRLRIALLVTGIGILAPNLLYFHWLMHATELDLHHLWFKSSPEFFAEHIGHASTLLLSKRILQWLACLLIARWLLRKLGRSTPPIQPMLRTDAQEIRWAAALCLCVLVGVIICGIAISILVAPSFSDRNLLTCAPFAWLLLAIAYDAFGPRRWSLLGAVAVGLLALTLSLSLLMVRGRWLPRTDPWRDSAHYVAGLPHCVGQIIPVILPFNYNTDTANFRTLTKQAFFGYYLGQWQYLRAYLPSELAGPQAPPEVTTLLDARTRRVNADGCPLLAWGVHDIDAKLALELAQRLARQQRHDVAVQPFVKYIWRRYKWSPRPAGYVFLLEPDTPTGGALTETSASTMPAAAGDRVVVRYTSAAL